MFTYPHFQNVKAFGLKKKKNTEKQNMQSNMAENVSHKQTENLVIKHSETQKANGTLNILVFGKYTISTLRRNVSPLLST